MIAGKGRLTITPKKIVRLALSDFGCLARGEGDAWPKIPTVDFGWFRA
jgi:hypothetical protein